MGDQEGCAPRTHPAHSGLYPVLRRAVDGTGRVVEDEDPRIREKRASDGDPLPLSAGEHHAPLADDRLVAPLQASDELVGFCLSGAALDLALGHLSAGAKGDVLPNRSRKEEHILLDGRDLRAERSQVPATHVHTVDQHATLAGVVDAVDQPDKRGLAGASLPDDGDRLPRVGAKADPAQHRVAVVGKAHILKGNLATHRTCHASGVLIQLCLGVDHIENAAGTGDAPREQGEHADGGNGRRL